MHRWRGLVVALLFAQPGSLWADPAAPAANVVSGARCEANPQRGDRLEIVCSLPPERGVQRLRFRAYFAGSHDDTTLSMVPTIEGQPLACDDGSRMRVEGEDGDVHLECRFRAGSPASRPMLKVQLSWHHARYTSFELVEQ
jgi:hypothetical protein